MCAGNSQLHLCKEGCISTLVQLLILTPTAHIAKLKYTLETLAVLTLNGEFFTTLQAKGTTGGGTFVAVNPLSHELFAINS